MLWKSRSINGYMMKHYNARTMPMAASLCDNMITSTSVGSSFVGEFVAFGWWWWASRWRIWWTRVSRTNDCIHIIFIQSDQSVLTLVSFFICLLMKLAFSSTITYSSDFSIFCCGTNYPRRKARSMLHPMLPLLTILLYQGLIYTDLPKSKQ